MGRSRFLRMQAVGLAVHHVVDEIDHARQGAEDANAPADAPSAAGSSRLLAEEQRGEDDEVLRPLVRPERADETLRREGPTSRLWAGRRVFSGRYGCGRASNAANEADASRYAKLLMASSSVS